MRAALVAPAHAASQAELLRAFDLPVRLLQDRDALARVAAELVEDKAADGVRYVEIRWAPSLHTAAGLSTADVIEAVADGTDAGVRAGGRRRAPDRGPPHRHRDPGRWIPRTTARSRSSPAGCAIAASSAGTWPAPRSAFPIALAQAASFDVAREAGLRITCHAGEWGGAPQVRRALELRPGADRSRLRRGRRSRSCAPSSRDRGITLDLCPTSNVQAGIYDDGRRPPARRASIAPGVPVTLSTDDATVSDITLSDEYARAIDAIGLTPAELWAIDRHALDVAFADEATLAPLRAEFDAWAAADPELRGRLVRLEPGAPTWAGPAAARRSSAAASSVASAATAVGARRRAAHRARPGSSRRSA